MRNTSVQKDQGSSQSIAAAMIVWRFNDRRIGRSIGQESGLAEATDETKHTARQVETSSMAVGSWAAQPKR